MYGRIKSTYEDQGIYIVDPIRLYATVRFHGELSLGLLVVGKKVTFTKIATCYLKGGLMKRELSELPREKPPPSH